MSFIKQLIHRFSNWIYIRSWEIILGSILAMCLQIINRWDWSNYWFTYFHVSSYIDWIWYVYAIFTVIAFINFFIRKLWNFLDYISFY
jgi:hypothetical protein